ncbi:MAG: AAA family ATPase [Desulfurivibrionaceae bacterium]|nr:AAA family ATPase [Desulfobulbales bacterium]MDT8335621.1 AAA family ATPase [Desulfurivibrionaceae bacterium]
MYSKHFNLNENPFSIAPDPRYLYMSSKHQEALAHLMYGLKTDGGFVLLTGEVGTGKTTVCRCLLEQLPADLNVAFVLNPKLTATELLATVCDELGIDYPPGQNSIKEQVDNINRYLLDAHAAGRKTVLIIDEAQNLAPEVLEQIRLLTNLETDQRKLLQIVMLGQPELRDQLARPELRQLAQRITARYHLGPLGRREVAPYINHRLGVAGYHKKLFPDKVVNRIYRLTKGIPRLINVLCDRTLLGTYVEGREQVDQPTLRKAAREVFGAGGARKGIYKWLVPVLFAISLGLAILFNGGMKKAGDGGSAAEKQAATGAASIAADRPAPVAWPADIPHAKSYGMAFEVLFGSWDRVYRAQADSSPCEQAAGQGLACLDRQGSLGSLRHLDRPAVLKLVDRQGSIFYAPLLKLTERQATLLIDSREVSLSTAALEKQWYGAYTLLWQPPPGYSKPIVPEGDGPEVQWLANAIGKTVRRPPADADLGRLVALYQMGEGLMADGIVGPETLIHLNSSIGHSGPTLVER